MDVYEIIFYRILQFQPSDPLLHQNLPHDLLYAILLPTIALYIILNVFSTTFAAGHHKIKNLIIVGALGVIIINGWYPLIANMFVPIFILALILGTVKVFKRMVISKETEAGLLKLGARGAGKVGEWFYKKYKKYDKKFLYSLVFETVKLENELKALDNEIRRLTSREKELKGEGWAYALQEIHKRRNEVERKLNENKKLRLELGITNEDWERIKREILEKFGEEIIKQTEADLESTLEEAGVKEKKAEKEAKKAVEDGS